VGSRLWLATAIACRRDGFLVHLLLRRTLATVAGRTFLLAVDGFANYVTAARPHRAHPTIVMVMVSAAGLRLKAHGRDRTLKGHADASRAARRNRACVAPRPTFQGPVPALTF